MGPIQLGRDKGLSKGNWLLRIATHTCFWHYVMLPFEHAAVDASGSLALAAPHILILEAGLTGFAVICVSLPQANFGTRKRALRRRCAVL